MSNKRLRFPIAVAALLLLAGLGYTAEVENQQTISLPIHLELSSDAAPVISMRAEWVDSFERSGITPWTTGGDVGSGYWGIRDTADTYGPQAPAWAGYRYAGHPSTDLPEYPSSGANPGLLTWIASPTVDITGWPAFYIAFSYWAALEGAMTNFDGAIVEISSNNGTTWQQVDSTAVGHLNPTYDAPLANTGQLGTRWAYCYSTNADWVIVSSQDLMGLGYVAAGNQVKFRITFASDALSGGQGFFIDDIYVGDAPPPDLQPPLIVHTPLVDTPDTLSAYTVSATITDAGSGVNADSIVLYYEIEGGSSTTVPMTLVSGDIYEADIPAQNWHTEVYYRIRAADQAGNWGQTALITFEVTSARTIIYDDNQPNYAPLVELPGDGCFTRFDFQDVNIDTGLVHRVKILFEGPGEVDIRIYQATSPGQPGPFIDSIAGFVSPGYDWSTIKLTDLNVQSFSPYGVFVGYIAVDTVGILRDVACDYLGQMWNYQSGVWATEAGGDFLMRLKVIPLDSLVGIDENTGRPLATFSLAQVAPNPVRATGTIEYQLPTAQRISLAVYDVTGQLVRTLVDGTQNAGTYQVVWDGRDARGAQVSSGVYLYRLQGESESVTKKMIFVR